MNSKASTCTARVSKTRSEDFDLVMSSSLQRRPESGSSFCLHRRARSHWTRAAASGNRREDSRRLWSRCDLAGILAENLLDLKTFVPAQEIATHFPELIANNTVNGQALKSFSSGEWWPPHPMKAACRVEFCR